MPDPDPNELSDAAKAEISAAIKIIRSDYPDSLFKKWFGEPRKPDDNPPPPKDKGAPTGSKKKGIWWGDSSDEPDPTPTPPPPNPPPAVAT